MVLRKIVLFNTQCLRRNIVVSLVLVFYNIILKYYLKFNQDEQMN